MIVPLIRPDSFFPPELPPVLRHTLSGESRVEDQVQQDLARLAADAELSLAAPIIALALVGRFARGEGSVTVDPEGDARALGGYHCIAVLERPSGAASDLLAEMERTWSGHLGVPLRIHPVIAETLRSPAPRLWWMDIQAGNFEPLGGDMTPLRNIDGPPECESTGIDLAPNEAGWLLTEQATLLALAMLNPRTSELQLHLRLHALTLACSDATLLMAGRFGRNLRERRKSLMGFSTGAQLDAVDSAMQFFARPDLWTPSSPEAWLDDQLSLLREWHLRLEQQRVGTPSDLRGFVRHRRDLFPPVVVGGLRARTVAAIRNFVSTAPSFPYVTGELEVLARVATGLIYGQDDPGTQLMCARLLNLEQPTSESRGENMLTKIQKLYFSTRDARKDLLGIEFYS